MKSLLESKIEKSEEKLDSMAVLMLHYCAGLQHCLDQEEVDRVKQQEEEGEEEEKLRDEDSTSDNTLEHIDTDGDRTVVCDPSMANTEGAGFQNGELITSPVTSMTEESGQAEQFADVTKFEGSGNFDEELTEDAALVSFAAHDTTASFHSADDLVSQTSHDETENTETETTDIPFSTAKRNFQSEGEKQLVTEPALSVEILTAER